jgi:hypothetical protein
MKTIYKYELERRAGVEQVIKLPEKASIISVGTPLGEQAGLCFWAKVDTEAKLIPRKFVVCWTGNELPASIGGVHSAAVFYGTVQTGPLVWHIFEVLGL